MKIENILIKIIPIYITIRARCKLRCSTWNIMKCLKEGGKHSCFTSCSSGVKALVKMEIVEALSTNWDFASLYGCNGSSEIAIRGRLRWAVKDNRKGSIPISDSFPLLDCYIVHIEDPEHSLHDHFCQS